MMLTPIRVITDWTSLIRTYRSMAPSLLCNGARVAVFGGSQSILAASTAPLGPIPTQAPVLPPTALPHPVVGAIRDSPFALSLSKGRPPLTPPPCPHAPTPATLPPCHTHSTSSNRPPPERSASMTAWGSAPKSRGLFQQHRDLGFGFISAMRHNSYKANARTRFPQIRRPRKDKVSSATTAPQNKAARALHAHAPMSPSPLTNPFPSRRHPRYPPPLAHPH